MSTRRKDCAVPSCTTERRPKACLCAEHLLEFNEHLRERVGKPPMSARQKAEIRWSSPTETS
jgi:hypothetical protein